jgi:membrane peptidoglycan carboxypeptidase
VPVDQCEKIDTGGYHVTTTLDLKMQSTVQKWLYAAAYAPNHSGTTTVLKALKIPKGDWGWLQNLRGKNIHNAASAVEDYRTGEILAYAGSASFTARASKKFQPQFDVLSDGWRQPGSSIKPFNYSIGIEDKTMTAATLFMDVTTNFGGNFVPTQADHAERGPVRLREALQFSLNIPSIKASLMNGLDHFYEGAKKFGLRWVPGSVPVTSEGIGTIETHPIDMIGAYGALADGGKLMPRTMILSISDSNGNVIWPVPGSKPAKGTRVVSPQTAYIMTSILAGNSSPKVNPFWGEWAIYDHGVRRPAAYKTGTTNDNRDVHAYGYLAPPKDPSAPALVVGVWMGNSDNSPNTDTLSLKSSAPLWSRILADVSRGTPMAAFRQPGGLVTATIDANTGFKPGPWTSKQTTELFLPGTQPTTTDDFHHSIQIDAASGLLWQDGCVGPMETVGALDLSQVEAAYPTWQKYDNGWARRAARGSGSGGGLKGTHTSYFYGSGFYPYGRTWGGVFAPSDLCPLAPPPTPPPCTNPFGLFCPPPPSGEPTPPPNPTPTPTRKPH